MPFVTVAKCDLLLWRRVILLILQRPLYTSSSMIRLNVRTAHYLFIFIFSSKYLFFNSLMDYKVLELRRTFLQLDGYLILHYMWIYLHRTVTLFLCSLYSEWSPNLISLEYQLLRVFLLNSLNNLSFWNTL